MFPSDYYTLVLEATDDLGNKVVGQSAIFALKSKDPLPQVNTINIYSPLNGSYWLAGSTHRIRIAVDPNGILQPSRFTTELLYVDGSVAQIISSSMPLMANDTLLGNRPDQMLNYTVWDSSHKINF